MPSRRRRIGILATVAATVAAALTPGTAAAAESNLAVGSLATASSAENAGLGAGNAVDGDPATRWSSAFADPQTLHLDLGARADLTRIVLLWEAAYGSAYTVDVSADGTQWTQVAAVTDGDGGTDELSLPAGTNARHVRLTGTTRATPFGYSLFEVEVFGEFTEDAVSLTASTVDLPEGGSAAVSVRLNRAADHDVTVRYATRDGTAVAGSDYTAANGVLTFPAGTTTQTVTLAGNDDALDERAETFELALSDATPAGTVIGPRGTATVRIGDDDDAPFDGRTRMIHDFDAGPGTIFTFGGDGDDHPALSSVPAEARPGNALRVQYNVNIYGGLVHNLAESQDWRDFDGISFWLEGSGTGREIQFEIKDGGTDGEHAELWETFVTDDSTQWRLIRVPFGELRRRTSFQPPGAPTDAVLNLTTMWGWAINLPQAAGEFTMDNVEVYEQVVTLDSFEGEVPFGFPAGIFTFGADGDDHPVLSVAELARPGGPDPNHALRVDYGADEGGYGGLVHNLTFDTDPQDWSTFGGFRFWWYGTNDAPLPPGSGPRIFLEIKDGGAHAEASELWNTSFTDDSAGWTLIEIPFRQFRYRTDFQPIGGINQILDLTAMWGYAFTPPVGREDTFYLDDVQIYGVATAPPAATVGTAAPVYPVAEGTTATVSVVLTTTDGDPLDEPVTVEYATGGGSATPGTDYTPVARSLTFPTGTPTGATASVAVPTVADAEAAEVAETVDVTLRSPAAAVTGDPATVVINAHGLPYLDPARPVEERVEDLLGRMTLAEKVGQMTQAERVAVTPAPDDIAGYALGSLLSGGGSVPNPNTPQAWADMVDAFQLRAVQTRLQIPLIYGVDAVHGHNNVVGATIFPHNVGLGATRSPGLVRRVGAVTAAEVHATGVAWDFSPCLCVSRDERWGRAYESFGEDPALAAAMTTIVDGLQGTGDVLATIKHWVGDGGTTFGSSTTGGYTIDQGVTHLSYEELFRLHIAPYLRALDAGAAMPSYSSVDFGSEPTKMHANRFLITDVLKGQLRFAGFVISDWQGIDQIPGDYRSDIRTAVNAGIDMVMVPYVYQSFTTLLREEVEAGRIPVARVDDAVRRILRQKFRLGLFEQRYADRTGLGEVGSVAHRAVAREAAARSQVLLRNAGGVLPLPRTAKVYVAGSNADDIGNQSGGWTISWQGSSGAITPGTTILGGIRGLAGEVTYSRDASAPLAGHDVGVVVVGETPYAEGVGDIGNGRADLSLSAVDRQAVERVCAALRCVVLVVSGRPMIDPVLAEADGLVASWLPGTEGAGVAEPLFGVRPYTGRLPVTWPRSMAQLPINVGDAAYDPLYAFGWGLRTDPARPRLTAARDALAAALRVRPDVRLALGLVAVDLALLPHAWRADGSVRDATWVLGWLEYAATQLERSRTDVTGQYDPIVSVARDVAQARPAPDPTKTSEAEHALLSGDPSGAIALLRTA